MKSPNHSSRRRRIPLLLLLGSLATAPVTAAPLYVEPFDSAATAKVLVNQLANTGLAYVDYSSIVRDQPGGGGPVTVKIPEAPNRIPGSAATRGVLLNATYTGTARTINLLASGTPGGAPANFSGNYRMTFDMWLAVDLTATVGTTEVGLFGIGQTNAATLSYARRASAGAGTFSWLSSEGGIGAGNPAGSNGDNGIFIGTTPEFFTENGANSGLYGLAFPQGRPIVNTPSNQWTQVELLAVGNKVTLYFNGVKFGETTNPASTSGFATIGYEDPFTGSTPSITGGSPRTNQQFGLFDNFRIDSVPGAPSLEASPSIAFTTVTDPGLSSSGEFTVVNSSLSNEYRITGGTISGANAADFSVATTFPVVLPSTESALIAVNFIPSAPNGLKVASLSLTTNDPNQPVIQLPLQARRTVNSIEGAISTRIASVSAVGGTGTGQIGITNNSENNVFLNSGTITGADGSMFSVTATYPLEVPPFETVFLPVSFTPTGAAGLKSAALELATTDPSVPVLSVVISARYGFGPPLLAHFKLNETSGALVDATTTSPSAAVTAPLTYAQPSLLPTGVGTAIGFNSLSNNSFAFTQTVHLPNVSVSMWIKPQPKDSGGNRTLLHRASAFTTSPGIYALYLTPTGQLVLAINGAPVISSQDGAIVDGTVYQIGFTHSDQDGFGNVTATRSRLFINGQIVAETEPVPPDPAVGFTDYNISAPGIGLYIGHTNGAGDTGYTGVLDDLQIYSFEITPGEMAGLFSQPGKTVPELTQLPYRITSVQYDPATQTVTLVWNSAPGAVYSVQQSTTTSGFADVPGQTGIVSGGMTTTASFTAAPGPRRFFHIRRTSN